MLRLQRGVDSQPGFSKDHKKVCMSNRRVFFKKLTSVSAGVFAGRGLLAAQQPKPGQGGMGQMDMQHGNMQHPSSTQPAAANLRVPVGSSSGAGSSPVPVTTLDIGDLPFTMDNGVKVFSLVAEPVKQVIVPGRTFDLWGFKRRRHDLEFKAR